MQLLAEFQPDVLDKSFQGQRITDVCLARWLNVPVTTFRQKKRLLMKADAVRNAPKTEDNPGGTDPLPLHFRKGAVKPEHLRRAVHPDVLQEQARLTIAQRAGQLNLMFDTQFFSVKRLRKLYRLTSVRR